jgi:enhancing lycopene biosynthesis protein 2
MKYVLIIWVCSFIEGNGCLAPMESPKLYDSWYECSMAAQKESISIIQKMGYANVNKYQVGTKYTCKLTDTS